MATLAEGRVYVSSIFILMQDKYITNLAQQGHANERKRELNRHQLITQTQAIEAPDM